MTSEFPDPKPVRTISLRPDGTPIGAAVPPDQPASNANAAAAPAEQPSKPAAAPSAPALAPKTTSDATGAAQPSTPKIELPTKLSPPKSSARVAVGKTERPRPTGRRRRPASRARHRSGETGKGREEAEGWAGRRRDRDDGAIAPPVDATAATTSGGWSVQLAAPRSEAEAKSEATRLTSKYGADLNGSAIGVHKAEVNGETIYRLRVVGLTKADAAAICARLKGEGGQCFIAK